MTKLFEGLKEGDLDDLILPLLSIDEYESKLDDDSLVVGFYVQDYEPAKDLNRFIQKGDVSLLDTDVSPAPNEDGYFMVFVELMRNENFPERLIHLLDSLKNLVMIQEWQFRVYNNDQIFPCDKRHLEVMVRLAPEEDEIQNLAQDLNEFFKPSILDNLEYTHPQLILERQGIQIEATLIDFGAMTDVRENNAILNQGVRLDEAAQSNVRRLQGLLGAHWLVEPVADYAVLSYDGSTDVALLRFQ